MWHIAIIEDDKAAGEALQAHLERYALESQRTFQIALFPTGTDFLCAHGQRYDLVFMDIDLPGINGMDTAKKLRSTDRDVSIIFVTNMAEYAIEGYSVAAADYMVKPLDYGLFQMKLSRVLQNHKERASKTVVLDVSNGIVQLTVAEIEYIEVMGHHSIIHTTHTSLSLRKPIGELERIFRPFDFLRCNQCFLINPVRISAILDGFVCIGDTKLPISRNRKKEFMAAFARWAGKQYG